MKFEKFVEQKETLETFFQIFCTNKHNNQAPFAYSIFYANQEVLVEAALCNECKELFEYALNRLYECPHEEKPRCRKCPTRCYEPKKFAQVAKVMRYSAIRLGLGRVKKLFNRQK